MQSRGLTGLVIATAWALTTSLLPAQPGDRRDVRDESDADHANLAALTLSAGTLAPAFTSNVFSYTATVPFATNSLTVTPTAADTNATITVSDSPVASGNPSDPIGLTTGTNLIAVVVVSPDPAATNTYMLIVDRVAPPPTNYVWTQTAGGTQAWSTVSNWSGGVAPDPVAGDTVDCSMVDIGANTVLTLDADRTAGTWKFGDTSTTKQSWTVSGGSTMLLEGPVPTLWSVSAAVTLNCVIAGNQGVTVSGGRGVTLAGNNTFTGGLTVSAGATCTPTTDAALGALGGSVTFSGSATLSSGVALTFNRDFVLTNNAIMAWAVGPNNSDGAISGAVSGDGGIVITSTRGLKLLSTANSFTGPVTLGSGIFAGRFEVSSLWDGPGAGTVNMNPTGYGGTTLTLGTGAMVPLVLNYRQCDIGSAGGGAATLQNHNASAAITFTINSNLRSTPAGQKHLVLSGVNTGNNTIAGTIVDGNGTVRLSKSEAGTWVLTGTNTFSGSVTINAGILTIGGAGQLGAGDYAGSIVNAATLRYSSSADQTLRGVISGTGALTQSGAGTLTLVGTNTYTGATTVNAGTLALAADGALGVSNNVVLAGGVLDMGSATNALGTLAVTGAATIRVGTGAHSFGSSALIAWPGALFLAGELGAQTLRFGTDSTGLSAAQLGTIRNGPFPVRIDDQGYLRAIKPTGVLIVVR